MPIASELLIDTSASALALAQPIFGDSVVVGTATLTGAVGASATYSGADATLGGDCTRRYGDHSFYGSCREFYQLQRHN